MESTTGTEQHLTTLVDLKTKHHFPRRVDTSALLLICWQIFPFSSKEEERIYEIHIWHLRFGEVLHLRFDELLQIIDVNGFKGRIGFFFGKGVNVNEKVSQSLIIKNRDFLLLAQYPPIVFFCQPHCSLPTEAA